MKKNHNKPKALRWLMLFVVPFVIGFPILVWSAGYVLIDTQEFDYHEWGLVLEGQGHALYRTEGATQLLLNGKIDKVAVSGGAIVPDYFTSEFYIKEMVEDKAPVSKLYQLQHYALSTLEEAAATIQFFRDRQIDTVALITSQYHTARAKRIFNQVSNGSPYFIAVAIDDPEYRADSWILERHARSIFVLEWIKTLNSWLESYKEITPYKNVRWVQGRQLALTSESSSNTALNIDSKNDTLPATTASFTRGGVKSVLVDDNRSIMELQDSLLANLEATPHPIMSSSSTPVDMLDSRSSDSQASSVHTLSSPSDSYSDDQINLNSSQTMN